MTYEDIGSALRAEREKQNISVDTVANKLKISPRLIAALESGDVSALPHTAYVRGFIRSYANLIGISPDELQAWFEELPGPQPVEAPAPEIHAAPAPAAKSGSSGKWVAAFLVLLALCGGGWWAWQSGKFDSLLVPRPREVDFETKVPSAADYLADENRSPNLPAQTEAGEELAPPATVTAPIETPEPIAPAPQTPITEARTPVTPPAESSVPGQHKLIITATEECWIHSNADKTDTRQFSLRKGDTFALTFAKSLELKLGNAGGVRLRYDGKDLGPAGTSGQVKTLVYPPQE